MRTIYKYPVPIDDVGTKHMIPAGSIIRHVTQQDYSPCIWFEVDTAREKTMHEFRIFGTGHEIPDGWVYVGSAFDGPYVWHVLEKCSAEKLTSPGSAS